MATSLNSVSTWICQACGVEYPASAAPPDRCPVCEDSRQWVPPTGQQWTQLDALRRTHRNAWRLEAEGVWSIRTEPGFGIGQQMHLIETGGGILLWDCLTLIDDATIRIIQSMGGAVAMAISHPHYYGTMAEWSRALGGIPVYLHEADRSWVQRPFDAAVYWGGEVREVLPGATLIRCGGHFDGYQVLHHGGAVFAGDQPQVAMDRRWLTFLYSYPNMVPLGETSVRRIVSALEPFDFERLYGAFGRHVLTDAKGAVRRSADRYIRFLRET